MGRIFYIDINFQMIYNAIKENKRSAIVWEISDVFKKNYTKICGA